MNRRNVLRAVLILCAVSVSAALMNAQSPENRPQPNQKSPPPTAEVEAYGPVPTSSPITPVLWVDTAEQMKATGNVEVLKGEPVSIGWRAQRDTEHFSLVLTSPTGAVSTYPIKRGQNSVKLASSKAAGTLQLRSGLRIIASVKIIVTE
jgi:hypothetical protein